MGTRKRETERKIEDSPFCLCASIWTIKYDIVYTLDN